MWPSLVSWGLLRTCTVPWPWTSAPSSAWVDSCEDGRGGPRVQALLESKWTQRLLESIDEDDDGDEGSEDGDSSEDEED